jgi:hypothetical protein
MFNFLKILNLLLSSLLVFTKFIGVRYTSILIINNMLFTFITSLVTHFYSFYKKISNKINLKTILHTYYFNSFHTQLIFFFSGFNLLLYFCYPGIKGFVFFTLFNLFCLVTYVENKAFFYFCIIYLTYVILIKDITLFSFLKDFMIFYAILFNYNKQFEKLKKPESHIFINSIKIYRYHCLNELQIIYFLNYYVVCFVMVIYISNDIALLVFSVIIFAYISVLDLLNFILMSKYLNPVFSYTYKGLKMSIKAPPSLTLSFFALYIGSSSGLVDPLRIYPVTWMQKLVFGCELDQMGILCHKIITLADLGHPPVLENGFYDTRQAKLIIMKAGIKVPKPILVASFIPDSLILPKAEFTVKLTLEDKERMLMEIDDEMHLLQEKRKSVELTSIEDKNSNYDPFDVD